MRGLLSAFLFGVSTQAFQDNGIVRLLQLSANATADIDLALVPAEGSTNVAENTTATQNNTYVPPEWKKEWLIPDGVDFPLEFEKKGEFWMKNIAKRYQWANWWGYCGEASLQIAAMYHGTWVSQATIRDWRIDQKEEMTGERWNQWDEKAQYVLSYKPDPVIKRLHLTYSTFPGWTVPTPQYERFVVWMKRHIQEDNPVIFAAFVKTGRAEWYQHIAVAFGIRSTTLAAEDDSYNPDDLIDWLPLEPSYTRREWSTRAVQGFNETKNGTDEGNEVFRIPNNVTFGTAITGIKNGEGTLPVRLQMPYDSPYESPNLSGCNASVVYCFAPGEPEPFYVVIYVEDLTPGQRYLALRYDGYATVPKEGGFCSEAARANATQTWLFEAEREMMLIDDVLQQDQAVFYRAVPACEGMENATLTWQQNWLDYGWTFNETSREWSFHMWGMDYVATNGWTWADWEPENVTETASDSESNRLRM